MYGLDNIKKLEKWLEVLKYELVYSFHELLQKRHVLRS